MIKLYLIIWLFCLERITCLTKWCKNEDESCHIDDFERFSEISMICYSNISIILLDLWPNKRLVFDEKLNNLNCSFQNVFLNNIKEIYLNTSLLVNQQVGFLNVYNSDFRFVFDELKFEQVFFSQKNIRTVKFDKGVKYFNQTPTIIFKDSRISGLTFYDMVNTTIKKNYLRFEKTSNVEHLNSKIKYLELSLFKVKLDNRLLDEDVFEKVQRMSISNQIEFIEVETFKSFKYLKELAFFIYSVPNFFQNTGTAWMRNLNSLVKVDYKNISEITKEEQFLLIFDWHDEFFIQKAVFPDEDFCFFKNFPHENYVLLITFQCSKTCTFLWLIQYYTFFKQGLIPSCYENILNNLSCDFSAMLNLCTIQEDEPPANGQYGVTDLYSLNDPNYKNKQYDFWISIVVIPLFSIYGIIVNILNIIVLSNKHLQKNKNNKMFDQMLVGSYVNVVICLIYLFGLSIKCIEPIGNYCMLELIINKKYRYFALTVYVYIGSVLKTCSKLVQIIIALDRFILSTDSKNKLFLRISTLSVRKFLMFSLVFSLLVNVVKIFEFKYQLEYQLDEDFRFPQIFKYYFNFYFPFAYFNVINILINNCMFLAFELIIYFKMLHFVHRSVRNKIKLLKTRRSSNNSENIRAEKNIKRMIIISCIIIFFLHLPDLMISTWLAFTYSGLDYNHSALDIFSFVLNDISDFCYIISYTLNFFIYYFFNSLFQECFRHIFLMKGSNSKSNSNIHSVKSNS